MRYFLTSIFLLSLVLVGRVQAGEFVSCVGDNWDFVTATGTITQTGTSSLDCVTAVSTIPPIGVLYLDRSSFNFLLPETGYAFGSWNILDADYSDVETGSGGYVITPTPSLYSDGYYLILYSYDGSSDVTPFFPFYVVDGKFYFNLNDIPNMSTTTTEIIVDWTQPGYFATAFLFMVSMAFVVWFFHKN